MLPGKMENSDNKIQIITNSEIRYRGTLYQVNPTDKTIALREVISYGTEDRRTDRVIPPVQTVYDCIVFRSTDIKELEVVGNEPAEPEKDELPLESQNTGITEAGDDAVKGDNAIDTRNDNSKGEKTGSNGKTFLSNASMDDTERNPIVTQSKTSEVNKDFVGQEVEQAKPNNESNTNNQASVNNSDQIAPQEVKENTEQKDDQTTGDQNSQRNYDNKRGGNQNYRGGDKNNRNPRNHNPNYNGPKPAYRVLKDAQQDFDFDAMEQKMRELELVKEEFKEEQVSKTEDQTEHKYNPDSFFDDISTSLENRGGEDDDHYKQYDINNETFGYVTRRGRGRGNRGGRGGGGGYRGRGTRGGGYNNNRGGYGGGSGGYNNNRGGYGGGYNNNNYNNNREGGAGGSYQQGQSYGGSRGGEGGEGGNRSYGGYNNNNRYGGRGNNSSGGYGNNNGGYNKGGYNKEKVEGGQGGQTQGEDYTRKY